MIRKIISVFLLICTLSLCGCAANNEIERGYIVSAIAFSQDSGSINLFLEAVTADSEEQSKNIILKGSGNSAYEAMENIKISLTKKLFFDHCAAIVLDESLNKDLTKQALRFCKGIDKINFGCYVVSSADAAAVFGLQPVSAAIGYDIMSMIEVSEEKQSTVFKNRLYEVVALNSKPMKTFWIPYIGVEKEEIFINGLAVFRENKMLRFLNNEQAVALSLITDSLTRGEIVVSGEKIKTQYCKVTYDFDSEKIEVNVHLKANGDKKKIKTKAQKLLQKEDIFGLGNIIYQEKPKLWEKIKNDYTKYYQKAEKTVNIYE